MYEHIMFEWFKLKRQKIWLIILIVPLLSVLLGYGNFLGNYEVLMDKADDNAWLEAWTQITLFYGIFFLPISSGILAALVCRTEHLNGGWKLQLTLPISKTRMFISKLVVVVSLTLLLQLSLVFFFLIGGKMIEIQHIIPWSFIFTAVFFSWLCTFTLSTIQLWLSYKIKSFGIPLSINIVLSLLVFAAYTDKIGIFYPWAQPSFAIAAPEESAIESFPMFISAVLITFIITLALAVLKFRRSSLKS